MADKSASESTGWSGGFWFRVSGFGVRALGIRFQDSGCVVWEIGLNVAHGVTQRLPNPLNHIRDSYYNFGYIP